MGLQPSKMWDIYKWKCKRFPPHSTDCGLTVRRSTENVTKSISKQFFNQVAPLRCSVRYALSFLVAHHFMQLDCTDVPLHFQDCLQL